jgi:osmotically-inducible protein OsmY
MAMHHMDRNGERDRRDERAEFGERYRERYGQRDADDGDRERRFGRFGQWDEDRGRDDQRMRYQGAGGQSGSQSGNMSDNMYREQTGYRGEDMYDRDRGGRYGGNRQNFEQEDFGSEQRGYGGGFGGQRMGAGGQRFGGQQGGYSGGMGGGGMGVGGMGGGQQDWQRRQEWQGGQQDWQRGGQQGYGGGGGQFGGQFGGGQGGGQFGGGQYGGGQYGGGQYGQQDWQRGMQDRQRGQQGADWGTGARQDYDRDYGGTLGHVDRSYGQQRGSQYGTSGPFGSGHRGKGPSGYARSDERIREDVCDALSDDDNVDASSIEISVKNGEVTLSGTVQDRRSKRMAEDCIENVRGVKDVTNNIRVQDRNESSGNGGSRTQAQSVSSSPEKDAENSKRPRA